MVGKKFLFKREEMFLLLTKTKMSELNVEIKNNVRDVLIANSLQHHLIYDALQYLKFLIRMQIPNALNVNKVPMDRSAETVNFKRKLCRSLYTVLIDS